MNLSANTAVIGKPMALQAQAAYGEVRRRMYAREREEVQRIQEEFVDLMSVDSLNALDDAYQKRYADMAKGFVDYGKQLYKNHDLRIPMDAKLEMMSKKRELMQQKAAMEQWYTECNKERELLARDQQMGTNHFALKESMKGMREYMEDNKKSGGKTPYTSVLVPAYENLSVAVEKLGDMVLKDDLDTRKVKSLQQGKKIDKYSTVEVITNFEGNTLEEIYLNRTNLLRDAIEKKEYGEVNRTIGYNVAEAEEELKEAGINTEKMGEWDKFVQTQLLHNTGKLETFTDENGEEQQYLVGRVVDKFGTIKTKKTEEERKASSRRVGGVVSREGFGEAFTNLEPYKGAKRWDEKAIKANATVRISLGVLKEDRYRTEGNAELGKSDVYELRDLSHKRVHLVAKRKTENPLDNEMLRMIGGYGKDNAVAVNSVLKRANLVDTEDDVVWDDEKNEWKLVSYEGKTSVVVDYDINDTDDEMTTAIRGKVDEETWNQLLQWSKEEPKKKEVEEKDIKGANLNLKNLLQVN